MKEGYGIYYFYKGGKYEGEFHHNLLEGYGVIFNDNNKIIFEGEVKKNEENGYGIYYYLNGDRYEGEFKNDEIYGYGSIYLSNGDKYEGVFKNGKNYGYGIFHSFLGFKFKKYFKNDKFEKCLYFIYAIILYFHKLYSTFIKGKISALFVIILIIGFIIQKILYKK